MSGTSASKEIKFSIYCKFVLFQSKLETSSRYSSRKHRQSNPDNSDRISIGSASDKSIVSMPSTSIKRNSVGQTSLHSAPAAAADRLSDRLSLDGAKHSFNNGGVKYYGSTGGQYGVPGRDPVGQYGKGFGTQYASVRYPSSSGVNKLKLFFSFW